MANGEYRFDKTLAFKAEDSGTAAAPIVYRAEGNNVQFKGSVVVDATKTVEVTDSRIKESVKSNIVAIDLAVAGVDTSVIRKWANHDNIHTLTNGEMNTVYINGAEQTLAQWPNGDNYATFATESSGNDLIYTDSDPDAWAGETNFWVGGYFGNDYGYSRKSVTAVDTANNKITLYKNENENTHIVGNNKHSNRWKAFNLLQELDAPGEYYIDTDKMILYIYPTTATLDKVELTASNNTLITFTEADNIALEGIKFAQARGTAVSLVNVDNIDIKNCSFNDIGGNGISNSGTVKAETDKYYWQRQSLDASYNCDITGCTFNNIGASAIIMAGGNVDTLTGSNNVISNCTITKPAQLAKYKNAIKLEGCGNTVTHNEISDSPSSAITYMGNDHVISYNEISNVIKETDDCAAIYCGRNALQRGTVIEYNYIHDLKASPAPRGFNGAIYWDDRHTGLTARNNIIENVNIGFIVNGCVDVEISNNVLINVKNNCSDATKPGAIHVINGGVCVNNDGGADATQNKFGSVIANPELYYSHYTHLEELITGECYNNAGLAKYNIIKDNTLVNCDDITIGTNTSTYGTVSKNTTASSYDKNHFEGFGQIGVLQ